MAEQPRLLIPLPPIDLRHVLVLTDDTAMLQHATCATPNLHHGYCTDDNARSLLAGVLFFEVEEDDAVQTVQGDESHHRMIVAMQRYLAFLSYAFNPETGRFRNFMGYNRNWQEQVGSEDSHARALWGLGVTAARGPLPDIRELANHLFLQALPVASEFSFIHPWAYTILGIHEYRSGDLDPAPTEELYQNLAGKLWKGWSDHASNDWPWWNDLLTWGNAKLPEALLVAGEELEREDMLEAGLKSLRWLLDVQRGESGCLSVIGNEGWFKKGQPRAQFDQQPIEAQCLVQACIRAADITAEDKWLREAERCFQWFTGYNDVNVVMYNPETGGGHDGLKPTGTDPNQGAESTLAYVLSALELNHYTHRHKSSR